MRWHRREAAERFAERRRREDEAPRLLGIVPTLGSLRLELEEYRAGSSLREAAHVRPIIVANAPALFFFPCQDSSCKDGGHDLTSSVCASLRGHRERFEATDRCPGQIGSTECARTLKVVATATYKS